MEGAVGGVVPHCLWDGVNDDLLFSGKKVPDWPPRSLSIRQACRATTSLDPGPDPRAIGRIRYKIFQTFHTISIRVQTLNLLTPTPFQKGESFVISALPRKR